MFEAEKFLMQNPLEKKKKSPEGDSLQESLIFQQARLVLLRFLSCNALFSDFCKTGKVRARQFHRLWYLGDTIYSSFQRQP